VTCSNRSEREESYDIIMASIKYFGDTFVPYMEAWFPLASNDDPTLLLLVKITDVIFRVNRESLGSNVNKYGGL
jgi:hypothetical protein